MIDSHIHIDLFKNPLITAKSIQEHLDVAVAVTMLPSHYLLACRHLKGFSRIHPAVGAHPLRSSEALLEVKRFRELYRNASYVGEIGLDGSREGAATFETQLRVFEDILSLISSGSFVTIHSRNAENETLDALKKHSIGPVCFHYFTGGMEKAQRVISDGHYLSYNIKMLNSRKHMDLFREIPRERLLFESDAPFLGVDPIGQLRSLTAKTAEFWKKDGGAVISQVKENFKRCRTL